VYDSQGKVGMPSEEQVEKIKNTGMWLRIEEQEKLQSFES
jgi:ubiquitin C-terminal hydrolase